MEILPVIDLSAVDRNLTGKKLTKGMESVGFVYLDNVPGYSKDMERKLLESTKWFYSLPLENKLLLSPKNWNRDAHCVYRGYVPIDISQGHMREQYETGEVLPHDDPDRNSGNPFYEDTPWPIEEGLGIGFKELMISYRNVMINTGIELLRLTALGLGWNENVFDDRFLPKSVSSLRLMHYPTYIHTTENPVLTCEEHVDGAFVTILATFSYSGLEILCSNGQWMSVVPRPGYLVVNIGTLLSRLTNGRFKATRHHVKDIGVERYSVPFFFEPRSDSKFEFPDDSSVITYGPWMTSVMRKFQYQYGHVPQV